MTLRLTAALLANVSGTPLAMVEVAGKPVHALIGGAVHERLPQQGRVVKADTKCPLQLL